MLQSAEREVKRAAAEVEQYKKHIAGLEKDLEAASARARGGEQELRRQQAAMGELDGVKAELEAVSQQLAEWRDKHACAVAAAMCNVSLHGSCWYVQHCVSVLAQSSTLLYTFVHNAKLRAVCRQVQLQAKQQQSDAALQEADLRHKISELEAAAQRTKKSHKGESAQLYQRIELLEAEAAAEVSRRERSDGHVTALSKDKDAAQRRVDEMTEELDKRGKAIEQHSTAAAALSAALEEERRERGRIVESLKATISKVRASGHEEERLQAEVTHLAAQLAAERQQREEAERLGSVASSDLADARTRATELQRKCDDTVNEADAASRRHTADLHRVRICCFLPAHAFAAATHTRALGQQQQAVTAKSRFPAQRHIRQLKGFNH